LVTSSGAGGGNGGGGIVVVAVIAATVVLFTRTTFVCLRLAIERTRFESLVIVRSCMSRVHELIVGAAAGVTACPDKHFNDAAEE